MTPPQRILCVCLRGNSRSAAMAWVLKEEFHRDAVAIGWSTAGPELMKLLTGWAERIIVMQDSMRRHIPREHDAKVLVCDVGEDRWVNSRHPELQGICREFVTKHLT